MTYHFPQWHVANGRVEGWAQVVRVEDGKQTVVVDFIPSPGQAAVMASELNIER